MITTTNYCYPGFPLFYRTRYTISVCYAALWMLQNPIAVCQKLFIYFSCCQQSFFFICLTKQTLWLEQYSFSSWYVSETEKQQEKKGQKEGKVKISQWVSQITAAKKKKFHRNRRLFLATTLFYCKRRRTFCLFFFVTLNCLHKKLKALNNHNQTF